MGAGEAVCGLPNLFGCVGGGTGAAAMLDGRGPVVVGRERGGDRAKGEGAGLGASGVSGGESGRTRK